MFRGSSEISMDGKGRIAFSARYREILMSECEGRIVVTIDKFERCLSVYPEPEWEKREQEILAKPSSDPDALLDQRLLIGNAREYTLDSAGRVQISPELRGRADLERDLMLVGQGRRLELWNLEAWKAKTEVWLAETAEAAARRAKAQQLAP